MKKLLKSKSFLLGVSVVLLFFLLSIGQKLYKTYQIESEINSLENEIAKLESGNKETLELINYFKTPEFRERQARSLLSLQKPGEFAVALPSRADADLEALATDEESKKIKSNLMLWWEYFFLSK